VYYAFDLLFLDGEDLRDRALVERRGKLGAILQGTRVLPLPLRSRKPAGLTTTANELQKARFKLIYGLTIFNILIPCAP
jgi:ATP-dependent DNA ligase